jgi:hypothetical protein
MAFNDVLFHCLVLRDSKRLASVELVDSALNHRKLSDSDPTVGLRRAHRGGIGGSL